MLQLIRDHTQGIFVWTVIVLIIAAFATFGLSSYLSGSSKNIAIKVNGEEISSTEYTRAYRATEQRIQKQMGPQFDAAMLPPEMIRNQVVEELISRTLIDQLIDDIGLVASRQQVLDYLHQIPDFQDASGQFSPERYREILAQSRLTTEGYEASVARELVQSQLRSGLMATGFVTLAEARNYLSLVQESRSLGLLLIPADSGEFSISDEEIQQYYETNRASFMEPERVRLAYIDLDVQKMASQVDIDEAELHRYYQDNIGQFMEGEEERQARQILVTVSSARPDAEALARAQELRERILKGEDFGAVAREASDDPVTGPLGGDLGMLNRSSALVDKTLLEAIFSLPPGQVSEPVRSAFGYHLIRVDKVRPPKIKSFASVRAQILEHLRLQAVEKNFDELVQQLDQTAYDNPDSLEPAAEEIGRPIEESDWIVRNQPPEGILGHPRVQQAAFSEDVLAGKNSDLLELSDTHFMILRVREHQAAKQKPLEDVREQIVAQLKREKRAERAFAAAEAALAKLQGGEAPDQVARELAGASWVRNARVGRQDPPAAIPADVIATAFSLPPPAERQVSYRAIRRPGGAAAVVAVYAVMAPEQLKETELAVLRSQMSQFAGMLSFQRVIQHLREQAEVSINIQKDDDL
ncbi:MAG TPA: hypothetical protein ENJ01_01085 [Gammaproteobacteria bacterium]|nr:hypothetical protein [Gammaproteobacteria bacterium]